MTLRQLASDPAAHLDERRDAAEALVSRAGGGRPLPLRERPMTPAQTRAAARAYVCAIRARSAGATTPGEHASVAADVELFLTQPGARLLTDPQRRNLTRTAATNRRKAA